MTISAHLLLAVALLIPAILVVICETTLRRRIRNYRVLQLFAIGSALVLVPLNAIATATHITTPHYDVAVVLRKTGLREGRHGNATGVER